MPEESVSLTVPLDTPCASGAKLTFTVHELGADTFPVPRAAAVAADREVAAGPTVGDHFDCANGSGRSDVVV